MRNRRASTIRTVSAFETEPNKAPFFVYAPTEQQFEAMNDRLEHGETAFREKYPELIDNYDLETFLCQFPDPEPFYTSIDRESAPELYVMNHVNERLAGPRISLRDFLALRSMDIWHESDMSNLRTISINEWGCWEMPKYIDHIKPDRALYPQPRAYSVRHGDVRKQMGAAWMWERVIGALPPDSLKSGKRAFWGDHRCGNKACVYPRHIAMGRPEANDAFTARLDAMEEYNRWTSRLWARPSFAYPDGLDDIVHESEVRVLSDRAVLLPAHMSRKELDACVRTLSKAHHLPDGGYTTDPGYHVLLGAIKRGLDFDEHTGCWNARFDLDALPPHKRTISHACGNGQCVNIRHMDIAEDQRKFYQVQEYAFITLPDGRLVNTETGESLPPYWESWMLYWNWLKKYSGSPSPEQELELEQEEDHELVLSAIDFEHIWVHPLTGCWENERFYPRWTVNGSQANAYGFHRNAYGDLGRSTHRYLLYKYLEFKGESIEPDDTLDADHRCNNRRCCNPLHMQFTDRESHQQSTRRRTGYSDEIGRRVSQLMALRKLGRRY